MPSPVLGYPENFSAVVESGPTTPGTAEEYELRFARRALRKIKERLGVEAIEKALQPDIEAGEAYFNEVAVRNGPDAFANCGVQLAIYGITLEEFLDWFHTHCTKRVSAMQAAQPEHWVVTSNARGNQTVIENLGETIARFHVTFEPPSKPFQTQVIRPDFPLRMSGRGTTAAGTVLGYILHQFRPLKGDAGIGFDANLNIFFPEAAGEELIEQHRQHLVVEFTNWTRACYQELKGEGLQL